MIARGWSWQAISALVLAVVGAFFEAGAAQGSAGVWPALGLVAVVAAVSALLAMRPYGQALLLFLGAHGAAWLLLAGVAGHEGNAGASFYLASAGAWLLAWRCATVLSAIKPSGRGESVALGLIIPVIFGAWILILWEAIVRGAGIPFLLLPPPSAIAARIATSADVLSMDVRQTIFKAVAAGYVIGCGAGFYLDATRQPYARNYRMYSYVTQELPQLIAREFPADMGRQGIFGHSMGGHGALTIALKQPGCYRSCSAFAPIVRPMVAGWSKPAFEKYLGSDEAPWRDYDAVALIEDGRNFPEFLVDQGTADGFLQEGLRPWLLEEACRKAGIGLELRMQEGYDHSYFFISTFMDDHLKWHADRLRANV